MTTVVAMSDTHGRHRRVSVPDGDILIHAGDFATSGRLEAVEEFNDWLAGLPHPHKIVVAGNCDGICERQPGSVRRALTEAVYLHHEGMEAEGLEIWGSPWQPKFLDMAFNLERGEPLAEKWADMPEDLDILITHGPPRGVLDTTSRGQEVGDRALLERVREVRPGLHVFGHVHESSGRTELGDTMCVNAACDATGKEPFVVELD